MKYFTKEWYDLMQSFHASSLYEPIPDRPYSDEEIQNMIEERLKQELEEDREGFDTPPQFDEGDYEDLKEMFDRCAKEDIEVSLDVTDETTGEAHKAFSYDSFIAIERKNNIYLMKEFENRGSYDEKEFIDEWRENFEFDLENAGYDLPDWAKASVDPRLLALGYLPKSIYKKIEAEDRKNYKEFDKITKKADQILKKETKKLPETLADGLNLHDEIVYSFVFDKTDFLLQINDRIYRFQNAVILENELDEIKDHMVSTPNEIPDYDNDSYEEFIVCSWLYKEVYYLDKNRYEVHVLLDADKLRYLTFQCSGLLIE